MATNDLVFDIPHKPLLLIFYQEHEKISDVYLDLLFLIVTNIVSYGGKCEIYSLLEFKKKIVV